MPPQRDLRRTKQYREVRRIVRDGLVALLDQRGYEFVRTSFQPFLNELEELAGRDRRARETLADAYYLLGDVFDLVHAWRAAARQYKKSIGFDPLLAASWRELGNMQSNLGKCRAACKALKEAIRLNPRDDFAVSDLMHVEYEMAHRIPPPYAKTPYLQLAAESLAVGRPNVALRHVARRRSPEAVMWRLCAAGANGGHDEVLAGWRRELGRGVQVHTSSALWFYLPRSLDDDCDFWSLLWKHRAQFDTNYYRDLDGLFACLPVRIAGAAEMRRDDRLRFNLMIRFHLARTRRDEKAARRLLAKYPKWTEVRDLLAAWK